MWNPQAAEIKVTENQTTEGKTVCGVGIRTEKRRTETSTARSISEPCSPKETELLGGSDGCCG